VVQVVLQWIEGYFPNPNEPLPSLKKLEEALRERMEFHSDHQDNP
jgi:hypothetical protein